MDIKIGIIQSFINNFLLIKIFHDYEENVFLCIGCSWYADSMFK